MPSPGAVSRAAAMTIRRRPIHVHHEVIGTDAGYSQQLVYRDPR